MLKAVHSDKFAYFVKQDDSDYKCSMQFDNNDEPEQQPLTLATNVILAGDMLMFADNSSNTSRVTICRPTETRIKSFDSISMSRKWRTQVFTIVDGDYALEVVAEFGEKNPHPVREANTVRTNLSMTVYVCGNRQYFFDSLSNRSAVLNVLLNYFKGDDAELVKATFTLLNARGKYTNGDDDVGYCKFPPDKIYEITGIKIAPLVTTNFCRIFKKIHASNSCYFTQLDEFKSPQMNAITYSDFVVELTTRPESTLEVLRAINAARRKITRSTIAFDFSKFKEKLSSSATLVDDDSIYNIESSEVEVINDDGVTLALTLGNIEFSSSAASLTDDVVKDCHAFIDGRVDGIKKTLSTIDVLTNWG